MLTDMEHSCASTKCDLPDDDEMVSCETCRRWWHYKCADFNPTLFDTDTPWFCRRDDCDEIGSQSKEENTHTAGAAASNTQNDVLAAVDGLIEAARVAQTIVDMRDQEIASLKAEMDTLKAQLVATSSVARQEASSVHSADLKKLASERLEAIRQIDCRHKQMVGPAAAHSTPLSGQKDCNVKLQDASKDSSCHQSDMANLLTILNRSQVQELPSFSGQDSKEWPYFESVFISTTVEGNYSAKENVARLRKALKGEAYNLVSDRLRYSTDANAVMDSLRAIYGRADVLVHSLTTNLLKLPSLSSPSDTKLRQWAVVLNGFVADIKSMDLSKELDNNYILTDLASRLSPGQYHDWQKRKSKKTHSNLEDFAVFLTEKLYDLPPELSKATKQLSLDKASGSSSSRKVLTHQPVIQSEEKCVKCEKAKHTLSECEEFKALSLDDRFTFAKSKGICFRCLKLSPHRWKNCSQKKLCGIEGCSKNHHPLLHPSTTKPTLNSSAHPFVPPSQIHSSHLEPKAPVMFKVVPVRLFGNNNKSLDTFAFLDDGSSITMVEKDVFDLLDLRGEPEQLTLQWTKGVSRTEDSLRTNLHVSGINKRKRHLLRDIYSVKNLELPHQSVDVAALKQKFLHLRDLPLPNLNDARPKILLGLDQAKLLVGSRQRSGKDDEPHAMKTLLGWTVFGTTKMESSVSCIGPSRIASISYFHGISKQDEELHDIVKRHFSTEEFGVRPPSGNFVSQLDARALEVMKRTLRYVDDHYEIGLLWSSDDVKLPDSYPMAEKRLISFEKSLLKRPELLKWMNQYIKDLLSKGYARIVSDEELCQEHPRVWYTPTFVVVNQNKHPPKPRVVADVAAKVNGVSLNSHLLKGPDNLVPLHAGLFKFRERKVAVNADVREMFHRIKICEADQHCQRFLWRDGDVSRRPAVYIMQVMMFGPSCSPTSAQFVKNHHANLYKQQCPKAVDGLVNRTYVDDYFNSHDTVEEAVAVSKDAIEICKAMNFELVGFQSNSRAFLDQIPESNIKASLVSIDPNESESYVTKILGMLWQPSSDYLIYKLYDEEFLKKMSDSNANISKREILRTIMRIFDPLGLISCIIIRGRYILQEIWREGFNWDEQISCVLRQQWLNFIRILRQIEEIKIPRAYTTLKPGYSRISLVVFVDASEKAFAAVSYWRFEHNAAVEVAIAMAKAKVAPVKRLSVPRLELQAAVLGVRIAEISSTFKFPSFVAVRVGEILETTNPHQWWFVRSADNVADDGTRWCDNAESSNNSRWFAGPEFLKLPQVDWPVTPGKVIANANKVSTIDLSKFSVNLHRHQPISFKIFDELKPRFRARWFSAVRVMALLLRFKDLLSKKGIETEPFATPSEIVRAQDWLFRKIQQDAFSDEITCLQANRSLGTTSTLLNLCPFIDDEARNPAILPKHHPLVELLVQHHHEANNHVATATTISDIRERAWVISIRSIVARVQSKCFMCKRLKAKAVTPFMGQLPEGRLAFELRPFTHVGVDCFGPMHVKYGRGTVKRFGMIFTCLSFRAVHIEVLNDLSMDQCYMAVRRFLIIRVVTKFIYSDNGLNLIGTKNRLDKDVKEMEAALGEYCAKYEGILWRFIPAYSPWMGGAWERLIKSIKSSIEFTLRGVTPREDVLLNALYEAQGQINRRPLTHIPVDPEDPRPLTPNSILFGDADRNLTAPGVFTGKDQWSKLYSRRAQHLMRELTRRWYTEYLPELTRRSKWYTKTKPVEIGSIVLVIEPGEVRSAWRLGRVTNVFPGPDGVVRIADVRLPNGNILVKRSVGRLAVLDLESSDRALDGPRDVIEP
ncbi:uncharacterized protein LOC129944807 [Eupeodes corollae]|uniref:uncharacterized protein LOC129944807 n=1 Tax=Eupeodes corollae TaxID=290404 RepID=UPI0024919763|nr:uncharacterized protein LOC129944807 [Eupeodes corollae]